MTAAGWRRRGGPPEQPGGSSEPLLNAVMAGLSGVWTDDAL